MTTNTTLRAALETIQDMTDSGDIHDMCAQALALTQHDDEGAVAEYQYRARVDWLTSWSDWQRCSEASYQDYVRAPLVSDLHYEVRTLYTRPADDPVDTATLAWLTHEAKQAGFDSVISAILAHGNRPAETAGAVDAPTEGWITNLNARKLANLNERGYKPVGTILCNDKGEYALFDSSCRWLTTAQYQRLMHEQDGSLFATSPAEKAGTPVKDHVIREVVNTLRDIAIQFHGTQQLRERIAYAIEPLLPKKASAEQHHPRPAGEIQQKHTLSSKDMAFDQQLSTTLSDHAKRVGSADAFGFALMEHLGPDALTGGKMTPIRAFELGWEARGQQAGDALDGRNLGALHEAIQQACAELPEKWSVDITLERGCGAVYVVQPNGDMIAIDGEGYLSDDVIEALGKAKDMAAARASAAKEGA